MLGEGRRIVNLTEFAKNLYCKQCKGLLDLNQTEKETVVGLASVLFITCKCGTTNDVHTETRLEQATNGGTSYLSNMVASANLLECGMMGYVIQSFFAALKIPLPPVPFDDLSLDSCSVCETPSVTGDHLIFGKMTQSQADDVPPVAGSVSVPVSQAVDQGAEVWHCLDADETDEKNTHQTLPNPSSNVTINHDHQENVDNGNSFEKNNDENIDDEEENDVEENDVEEEDDDDDNEDNDFSVPVKFEESENLSPLSDVLGSTRGGGSNSVASLPVKNHSNNTVNRRTVIQSMAMILNTSSTDKPYGCGVCFKAYDSEDLCHAHIQTHLSDKPFLCEDCGRGFVCQYNLKLHRRQHTGERPFRCEVCGRGFIRWFTLKRHQQKHQGVVHFLCQQCGDAFSSRESLKRHRRVHTGEMPFSCDQCDKKFRGESNLYAHRRRHLGIKPYKCSQCDAAFVESTHLARHRRTHTKEQPYICETCGARYTQSGSLAAHRRKHTGEAKKVKVLQCVDCGKMFNSYTQLKRHKRTHTGEKPYVCEFCQASFSQSSSLKAHRRIHTGERPFQCGQCGESFVYPRTLKRHMKKHAEGGGGGGGKAMAEEEIRD